MPKACAFAGAFANIKEGICRFLAGKPLSKDQDLGGKSDQVKCITRKCGMEVRHGNAINYDTEFETPLSKKVSSTRCLEKVSFIFEGVWNVWNI